MIKPAIDRKADVLEIEERQVLANPLAIQEDRVIALVDHCVPAPRSRVALAVGVEEIDDPPLGMHHIVVEIGLQPFPKLKGMTVEFGVAGQEVIGADDGRVPTHIAAAEIALLQNRDVGQPVLFCEVKGCRKTVPAAADDDNVVLFLGLGIAPDRRPARLAPKTFPEHAPG